jgi:predicted enzyme related to lactoylglutathione lyase
MTNPVAHFEIMGKDAIALQKFYHDVFGWKLAPPIKEMWNYSLFDNEGQGIGGGLGEGDARVTIYIEVDDPQAYLDKAIKAGATLQLEVSQVTPDTVIALFADPQGNTTGLLKSHPHPD